MILFVASNPSHLNDDPTVPFIGSRSEDNFRTYVRHLGLKDGDYKVINVSDIITPKNRPLRKSDISPVKLAYNIYNAKATKIIALGATAEAAIKLTWNILGSYDYFKLPHPSPQNRQLNRWEYIEAVLDECRGWLQ